MRPARIYITLSGRLHMRGSTKVLLLGVLLSAVTGACGQAEGLTAPDAWRASDAAAVPDGGQTTQDEAPPPPLPSDSTARWGGGMGSGT